MILRSFKTALISQLWLLGMILSCGVALLLVGFIISSPCWWAACFGLMIVTLNSVMARVINERATGASRAAFVRWGVIVNAIRMLTLVVIFAYMTMNFQIERGSFLMAGLPTFFVMMPIEVIQLFRLQNKAVDKFECRRDVN